MGASAGATPGHQGGNALNALPGVRSVGFAGRLVRGFSFMQSTGYGFTESVLGSDDSHHRVFGSIAASFRPTDWFGFALELDGRYDQHNNVQNEGDDGFVGDPRVVLLATGPLGKGFHAGLRTSVWFPGGEKPPSLSGTAISPEFSLLFTYMATGSPLSISGNVGFRVDRSAKAISDVDLLSRADRLSLGVSDSNAIPMGVAVTYRAGPVALLGEWFWDLHLGADAPPSSQSPMLASLGARWFVPKTNFGVDLTGSYAVNARPVIDVGQPLISQEPRFKVALGLHYLIDFTKKARKSPPPVLDGPPPRLPANIGGVVRAPSGKPLEGATIRIGTSSTSVKSQSDGRFLLRNILDEEVVVHISASGFQEIAQNVTIPASGDPVNLDITLERLLPDGEIRGTVRTYRGKPLPAKLTILPINMELTVRADGRFSVIVPPGTYEIKIEANGYKPQSRQITVETEGVTVLNVDLRRRR